MDITDIYIDKAMVDFVMPTLAKMAEHEYPKEILDRLHHIRDETEKLQAELVALCTKLQTPETPGIPGLPGSTGLAE